MTANLRQKAKWLLPIVIPGLLASAVLGGWKLWEMNGTSETPTPVQQQAVQQPAPAQKPTPAVEKSASSAPNSPGTTKVREPEPVAAAATAKPTGKKHEREENLLAVMAMRLHSEAYDKFIHQKGLGMSRMMPMLTVVKREWKKPDWTSEELAKANSDIKGAKDFSLIHLSNVNFFLDSNTKSEKEQTSTAILNGASKKEFLWEIKSLDLVGLVMHETPTVYISEKLPTMKDLANRPTREMDVFEMEGLEELMAGKDLYVRSKNDTIRVLGPVRAGKACLKCHSDAKDGDMLGAFSYTLRQGQYQMYGRGIPQQPNINPGPVNSPKQGGPIP